LGFGSRNALEAVVYSGVAILRTKLSETGSAYSVTRVILSYNALETPISGSTGRKLTPKALEQPSVTQTVAGCTGSDLSGFGARAKKQSRLPEPNSASPKIRNLSGYHKGFLNPKHTKGTLGHS
jgi:hypothetical protein